MEVRAVEYQPASGIGWAYLNETQSGARHWSSWASPTERPVETAEDLRREMPARAPLDHEAGNTLRLVLGAVSASDVEELGAWLSAAFEDLRNPAETASALCDPDNADLVMSMLEERGHNLFRLRIAVPRFVVEEGTLRWYQGTISVLEGLLLVLWHPGPDQDVSACAQVDGWARESHYSGEKAMPVTTLASNYVSQTANGIRTAAEEATRFVDRWEAELFASTGEHSRAPDLRQMGNVRIGASALQANLDRLSSQIAPGPWRSSWSSMGFTRIDETVAGPIDRAGELVSRLRGDVSDAFVAANTVAISEQLRSSREQEAKVSRLQITVTRLTSFLLVPGLVAAVFGANVKLPGSPEERAWAMVALMVAGALITYLSLRRLAERD